MGPTSLPVASMAEVPPLLGGLPPWAMPVALVGAGPSANGAQGLFGEYRVARYPRPKEVGFDGGGCWYLGWW